MATIKIEDVDIDAFMEEYHELGTQLGIDMDVPDCVWCGGPAMEIEGHIECPMCRELRKHMEKYPDIAKEMIDTGTIKLTE